MSTERRAEIERLFRKAAVLPASERTEFLESACGDASLRHDVEKLLQNQQTEEIIVAHDLDKQLLAADGLTQSADVRREANERISPSSSSAGAINHGRFLPGTVLSERYRIVGMLGQGGMGEVYRADDLELGQSVALKFLPTRLAADTRALERFRGEVRLARQVSHPNVCRVYDIGQIEGQWFLSMEYVDGEDLAQLLTRIGRFNSERATELARQLCMGLHAAHEKGVLHRDLKPANVMIDGRGKLLITDFGLSELADEVRKDDIRSGTPAYMAPEQLAGHEVTVRSDIYSLGIILHEIYTGEPVWRAKSLAELLEIRQSGAARPASSHVKDLDPQVEHVIECCLAPLPENRPSSALNVISRLPGGDPLAAALGAGQTPSPEMVAASGDHVQVSLRSCLAAIATLLLGIILNVWVEGLASPVANSSLDFEPAVLHHEVQRMLKDDFGYEQLPNETIHGFDSLPEITSEPISYWYRQRADELGFAVNGFWSAHWGRFSWVRPDLIYPEFAQPEESCVILSGDKHLEYFRAMPEHTTLHDQIGITPRWSEWFSMERTGFYLPTEDGEVPISAAPAKEIAVLQKVEDYWLTPPDAYDAISVWKGREEDGTEFIVEAAAWRGKPTYYRKQRLDETEPLTLYEARSNDNNSFLFVVLIFMVGCGVVLAMHNLHVGRGDRTGARRLAVYVAIINTTVLLSFCRFPNALVTFYADLIALGSAQVLFEVARTSVWYLGLEPFVRRNWPQILVSSSRLLEGRWKDPLAARDILVGLAFGALCTVIVRFNYMVNIAWGGDIPWTPLSSPAVMVGSRELIGAVALAHSISFFTAFFILMILLVNRIIFRSEMRALVITYVVVVMVVVRTLGGNPAISLLASLILSGAILFVLVRFGVLALIAFSTCRFLLDSLPLTFDPSKWYFSYGIVGISILIAIAAFAFFIATAGHRSSRRTTRHEQGRLAVAS